MAINIIDVSVIKRPI